MKVTDCRIGNCKRSQAIGNGPEICGERWIESILLQRVVHSGNARSLRKRGDGIGASSASTLDAAGKRGEFCTGFVQTELNSRLPQAKDRGTRLSEARTTS